jgi:membrane-associated phospholipid phosphatase
MTEAAAVGEPRLLASILDCLRILARRWLAPHPPAPPLPVPSLAAVAGLAAGTVAVIALDVPVIRLAERLPTVIVKIFRPITELGTSGYILAICALVACLATVAAGRSAGRRVRVGLRVLADRAIFVFAVVAISGIAAQVLKHIVGRARPRLFESLGAYHFDLFSLKASLASFPSGHATTSFAAVIAIALLWNRGRIQLLALASLVCLSRLILTAHYPSDIAGGIALGILTPVIIGRSFARRRIALTFRAYRLMPRGKGLVHAAMQALFERQQRIS